jgi:hypothetical protein
MAIVPNLGIPGYPIDLKYNSPNRTAANLAAVLALVPLYPGEIVIDLATGIRYRALTITPIVWGQIVVEM